MTENEQRAYSIIYGGTPSNAGYYEQSYNNALAKNTANYNNVMGAYTQAQNAASARQAQIDAGYSQLNANVQNEIKSMGLAERQDIINRYFAERGQQMQGLTNRGLGNTTVANMIQRGLVESERQENTRLTGTLADVKARYMSQVGLAGLGAQTQGLGLTTGLAGQYLGALSRMETPYPGLPNMGSGGGFGGYGSRGSGGGGGAGNDTYRNPLSGYNNNLPFTGGTGQYAMAGGGGYGRGYSDPSFGGGSQLGIGSGAYDFDPSGMQGDWAGYGPGGGSFDSGGYS